MKTYEEQLDEALGLLLEENNTIDIRPFIENPVEDTELDNAIEVLEEQIANGPMTFEQFVKDKQLLEQRSVGEKT